LIEADPLPVLPPAFLCETIRLKNLENILNLKQYLAIPKIGDADTPAPTKGVFGRIFLRQSIAAFPGEAP
jgi:hypothetical protein